MESRSSLYQLIKSGSVCYCQNATNIWICGHDRTSIIYLQQSPYKPRFRIIEVNCRKSCTHSVHTLSSKTRVPGAVQSDDSCPLSTRNAVLPIGPLLLHYTSTPTRQALIHRLTVGPCRSFTFDLVTLSLILKCMHFLSLIAVLSRLL
jgi:hypothetical protein